MRYNYLVHDETNGNACVFGAMVANDAITWARANEPYRFAFWVGAGDAK